MASVHNQGSQKAKPKKTPGGSRVVLPAAFGAPRGGKGPKQSNDGEGTLTLSRSELVRSIEVDAKVDEKGDYMEFFPSSSTMAWLYRLAKSFDQIVWHSVTIEYRPAVGTNYSGSLVFGIDWNAATTAVDRVKVQACTPTSEAPVWQPQTINVPGSRLQSRRFFILKATNSVDRSPFCLLWSLKRNATDDKTFYGDIWVHYRVSLMGPSA